MQLSDRNFERKKFMIFERLGRDSTPQSLTMLRSNSPCPRSCSPAVSEISVGSPSPPPRSSLQLAVGFRPINMKRPRAQTPTQAPVVPQRRKSSNERVKSFSIADILGKKDSAQPAAPQDERRALSPPTVPQPINERLPPQLTVPQPALLEMPNALNKLVHPWDAVRNGPVQLSPFFSPALLHYEQRLAWDYQRQLQEHFHAHAQLLRQMSLDPTIIPSEDGSERSRSSSTDSNCCSPEVNVSHGSASAAARSGDKSSTEVSKAGEGGENTTNGDASKKSTGDTPLDALFQLSTKNFDQEQDPSTLSIFASRPNPKKKRKSRTAFTNHQIFELEKRFLYQKYLSPADRDEIAAGLGLSNAQVITWFQNRRAKLKRDMEELKKDVESVKQLPDQSADISRQDLHHYHHHMQRLLHSQALTSTQPLAVPQLLKEMAAMQAAAQGNPSAAKPTAAEDKKDLKMLKAMTLMYYSGVNRKPIAGK